MDPKNYASLPDLNLLAYALHNLSKDELQKQFFDSGLFSTFIDFAKRKDLSARRIYKVFGESLPCGGAASDPVSMPQIANILSVCGTYDVEVFKKLMEITEYSGRRLSPIKQQLVRWEYLDEIREGLGLERINPVFETSNGLKTVLKLVGREYKLILEPLDGYRFVSKQESGIYSCDYIDKYRVVFHEDYKNCGKNSPFGFSNSNIYVMITKL